MQHHQHDMNKLTSATAACDYVSSPSTFHQHRDQERHQGQFHHLISEVTTSTPYVLQQEEEDPLPTFEEFQDIINDYLGKLSPKKRDKALVDHARYCLIQEVLKNPRNTSISTAQFRFWVKKMFTLQPGSFDLVCHDNKPVAMREQIYDILVSAHKEAHHGGRDKTSAIVRNQFSWIPKELVARFVRQCPTCISRRNGSQTLSAYTSKTSSPKVDYISSATASGAYCYDAVTMAAAAAAAAAATSIGNNNSTPALLYTPSSKAESDISASPSTDNAYRRSPQNCITASPSPPKRPFFGHNGLFDSGNPYEEESQRHLKLSNTTILDRSLPTNYQLQRNSLADTLPFTYRRQQQQQQQECSNMNYTTYTEQAPSYYSALINSYHNNNDTNDTNSAILNLHNNNNNTFLTIKIDQHETATANNSSNSILSHHGPEPSF